MDRVTLVVASAHDADPSIGPDAAVIAARCIALLDATPTLSAADLARAYLAEDRHADASWWRTSPEPPPRYGGSRCSCDSAGRERGGAGHAGKAGPCGRGR